MRYRAIASLFCLLLISIVALSFVSSVGANFHFVPPEIAVNSPKNGTTYKSSEVLVELTVTDKGSFPYCPTFAICLLDGGNPLNISFSSPDTFSSPYFARGTFNSVSEGSHILTVDTHITTYGNAELIYNASSVFTVLTLNPTPADSIQNQDFTLPMVLAVAVVVIIAVVVAGLFYFKRKKP